MNKRVFVTAGYNTVSLGTGRKEFNPRKPRPGLEHYLKEAGQGTIQQVGGAGHIDECVVGNFMASRFNRQAHLGAFMPIIDKDLRYRPATRVEGACASGGLAMLTAVKSVLAGTADVVLVIGIEVQNQVKAVYGADYLALAGWYNKRREGHAYFFPGEFSDRAQAYFNKYGREKTREAQARWYQNAVENARRCTTAQEYHNTAGDLMKNGLTEPDPGSFTPCLNVFDCSKVSDGASAILVLSEQGMKKLGIRRADTAELSGWGHAVNDITEEPDDLTRLDTMEESIRQAFSSAGITHRQLATAEIHDCFTIAAILAIEALGFAPRGLGPQFILEGHTSWTGKVPLNTTGGLIGWGHPTGATGVHMVVTLWEQLCGKAGEAQVTIPDDRPYGMSVNMGGNDKTVVSLVFKKN